MDKLPRGWVALHDSALHDSGTNFVHRSGAEVSLREISPGHRMWCWWPANNRAGTKCTDPKATRAEAMAAAEGNE